jgi:hypothetical protein
LGNAAGGVDETGEIAGQVVSVVHAVSRSRAAVAGGVGRYGLCTAPSL